MKKIDLSTLNALVKELNKQVMVIENIDPAQHRADHIVEMSKIIGLLGSTSNEVILLMGDVAVVARPKSSLIADDLLGGLLEKGKIEPLD